MRQHLDFIWRPSNRYYFAILSGQIGYGISQVKGNKSGRSQLYSTLSLSYLWKAMTTSNRNSR